MGNGIRSHAGKVTLGVGLRQDFWPLLQSLFISVCNDSCLQGVRVFKALSCFSLSPAMYKAMPLLSISAKCGEEKMDDLHVCHRASTT